MVNMNPEGLLAIRDGGEYVPNHKIYTYTSSTAGLGADGDVGGLGDFFRMASGRGGANGADAK